MKKLIVSAVAFGLMLAAPAFAADRNQHHRRHAQTYSEHHGQTHSTAVREHHATAVYTEHRQTRQMHRSTYRANRARQNAVQATYRANMATHRANRATVRANYATYRVNMQARHRYHWNAYRRPAGWYAHRWTYGERLPVAFYASNYWITDYISFGLMAPPDGLVWVRYGDDALLIDRNNGEVVRVVYNVFY